MGSPRAAIVGIGQTEFSQRSGRSELQLAVESVTAALQDAGLRHDDVQGLCTFTMDSSDPNTLATALGLPGITYFSTTPYGGGGACAAIADAELAVLSGRAEVVVVYRAMNERSGRRFGTVLTLDDNAGYFVSSSASLYTPYGIMTAAQRFAPNIARYMYDYGVTNQDFAPVSVASRRHAANNPAARFFGRPITVADHQASRWIVEPALRLLDCCLESDGGVAIVVTSDDRAKDLAQVPAMIRATSQGMLPPLRNYYAPDIAKLDDTAVAARALWARAGIGPADVQMAIIYDHFAPMVLMQLEALGFCDAGEGKDFVGGGRIEIGGQLPVNTHGGQLGEAYLHGMNGIAEAVRQVRGASINQVAEVEHVLVTSGPGVPTSAMILERRR